ncbi:MAG: hypothetical protein R3E50_10440 [Halioglobus sp.]
MISWIGGWLFWRCSTWAHVGGSGAACSGPPQGSWVQFGLAVLATELAWICCHYKYLAGLFSLGGALDSCRAVLRWPRCY